MNEAGAVPGLYRDRHRSSNDNVCSYKVRISKVRIKVRVNLGARSSSIRTHPAPLAAISKRFLLLIQSPQTEVLGVTVVTGDAWLTEEVAHTLRMLELIGRTDIPVFPGAEYPLVRTKEETEQWERHYGSVVWLGAWTPKYYHAPRDPGEMPEGKPTTKAADEDAAHFMVRMVRKYPHEVTIYEGGPMTNLALAISLDPEFPSLAKELVFMGGSLNPQTEDPEFANNPRHEFNLWFDPEAAHIALRAPWKKMVSTTVDISLKTRMTNELIDRVKAKAGNSPAAQYVGKYERLRGSYNYLWDELAAAAWLDPSLITKKENRYLDVDLDRGAGYGRHAYLDRPGQAEAGMCSRWKCSWIWTRRQVL
jgi:purine nucleosidase